MASIDDILSKLDGDASMEKKANQKTQEELEIENQAINLGLIEGTEKVATQKQQGENMNLQDIYNDAFGAELEKEASAFVPNNAMEKEAMDKEAAYQEELGEVAGEYFRNSLDNRLLDFAIKTAMNENPNSAAMKAIASSPSVLGIKQNDPQLDVNRRADDKAMDLTPEFYSLDERKAIAKAALKARLASGHPGDLSHKVVSTHDEDMIQGGSQSNA